MFQGQDKTYTAPPKFEVGQSNFQHLEVTFHGECECDFTQNSPHFTHHPLKISELLLEGNHQLKAIIAVRFLKYGIRKMSNMFFLSWWLSKLTYGNINVKIKKKK